MNVSTDPYVWIAAALTLCVFSFLYKDNPFFCFAEHLLVGLSAGYLICIYWHNVFVPELIAPLKEHGDGKQAHLWVAVVLCLMWACKLYDPARDLYRLALAFWVAIDMGLLIPTFMEAKILSQISGAIDISLDVEWHAIVGNIVLAVGTIASLTYFVFTKEHRGLVGISAKAGIWILMIGFGATFSYTILSRVYLLIGRLLFLMRDWLGIVT